MMVEKTSFPPEARDALRKMLNEYVSGVSEDIWCAGWHMGIEFYLWAAAQGDPEYARHFDDGVVDAVVTIAGIIGEWPGWPDTIPLSEMPDRYAEYRKAGESIDG